MKPGRWQKVWKMVATLNATITLTVPFVKLEDEIIRLNSSGFTVTRGIILDKNIKLYATRIFIQKENDDTTNDY